MKMLSRSPSSWKFEPLTSSALTLLESRLGQGSSLPAGLRDFLLKYNGGVFDESVFLGGPDGPVVVAAFLPVSTEEPSSIDNVLRFFIQEVGDSFVPFGTDPGGNYFLIGFRDEKKNKIFFWDHERNEVKMICESFEEFLSSLIVDA